MSDIQNILNLARTSLWAQQTAMDITGRNIANADNPDYTRQRVVFSSLGSTAGANGAVEATALRVYDRFLEMQLGDALQTAGRWETQQGLLARIEMLFDESSGSGLSQALSDFWNAWNDLANNPSGQIERDALAGDAARLTGLMNTMAAGLLSLQIDIQQRIDSDLEAINRLAEQIGVFNRDISRAEAEHRDAAAMRDARDGLIKALSSLVDVTTAEKDNAMVTVWIAGGHPLVENTNAMRLESAPGSGADGEQIVWVDSQGNETVITDAIRAGRLKGLLEVRDRLLPEYVNDLDALASGLIAAVNAFHEAGAGLDGTRNRFFSGVSAADIAVNPLLLEDPYKIAAGYTGELPGGASVALNIAGLQTALRMDEGRATFNGFYHALVGNVGMDLQNAETRLDHQTAVTHHIQALRESTSGVSVDEEMINLIKFQHAFEAAAKLVNTADELMETLIQMV